MEETPGGMLAFGEIEHMTVEAVVIRCGCGHPENHPDSPCPTPRTVEDHGIVAEFRKGVE